MFYVGIQMNNDILMNKLKDHDTFSYQLLKKNKQTLRIMNF
jgi:hypothetical protein